MGLCLRGGVEATEAGLKIAASKPKYPGASLGLALAWTIRDAAKDTLPHLLRSVASARLLQVFVLPGAGGDVASGHRSHVLHLSQFGIRELGPARRSAGSGPCLNSALIHHSRAAGGRVHAKNPGFTGWWLVGSIIAALSVFIMAVPPHWFQPIADGAVGHLVAHVWLGVKGQVNLIT